MRAQAGEPEHANKLGGVNVITELGQCLVRY